jgi:hypothetical protein
VFDLLHELAVVVQEVDVDARRAAARRPACLRFLGVVLQLLHLLMGDLQFTLLLGQRGTGLVAALLGDFNHLVQGLNVAHFCGSIVCKVRTGEHRETGFAGPQVLPP